MALDVVAALEKVLTASRRVYLAIFFASSAALFAPTRVLDKLSLTTVVNQYKSIPGVLFIITAGLLAADCALAGVDLILKRWERYFERRKQIAHLKSLTPHEKLWLYVHFIQRLERHAELPTTDQISVVLQSRCVLSTKGFNVAGSG